MSEQLTQKQSYRCRTITRSAERRLGREVQAVDHHLIQLLQLRETKKHTDTGSGAKGARHVSAPAAYLRFEVEKL